MVDRVERVIDKTFEADDCVVVVQKLPLRKPRYTFFVGRKKDGRYTPYFAACEQVTEGNVVLNLSSSRISKLIQEALDYIRGELQCWHDEASASYSAKLASAAKPKNRAHHPGLSGGPGSGKTAKNRARRAAKGKTA